MEAVLIEHNIQEERKEFYIDRLVAYFKDSHIDKENAATLLKMLEGYQKKLYEMELRYIYSNFLRESCRKLQKIIDTKISKYNAVTSVSIFIPLIDLGNSDFLPYCYKDDVSLEDAAAIYIMTKPKIINCQFIEEHKNLLIDSDLVKQFYFLFSLLKKGVEQKKLKDQNTLLTYRNFFLQYNILTYDIENWLEEEKIIDKTFSQELIINDADADAEDDESIQGNKIQINTKPDNKNESKIQRKLNNVLKLVYYMAEDKYHHEQGEEKATAKKLETLSGNTAQTIQKWLEDAAFLIPK